jgi:transcriptional regulator with XRE-family HTH domain
MVITKELSKAARALVSVTVDQLADSSGLKPDTLRSFESGRTKTLSATNQEALAKALEILGVHFIPENGGGAGVRLRDRSESD